MDTNKGLEIAERLYWEGMNSIGVADNQNAINYWIHSYISYAYIGYTLHQQKEYCRAAKAYDESSNVVAVIIRYTFIDIEVYSAILARYALLAAKNYMLCENFRGAYFTYMNAYRALQTVAESLRLRKDIRSEQYRYRATKVLQKANMCIKIIP